MDCRKYSECQKYTAVAVSPAQKPLRLIPVAGQPPLCVLRAHVGGRGPVSGPGSVFLSRRKSCGVLLEDRASPAAGVPFSEYNRSVGKDAWTLVMMMEVERGHELRDKRSVSSLVSDL